MGRPVAKQSYFTNKFNQRIEVNDNVIVVTKSTGNVSVRLGKFMYANVDENYDVTSVAVRVKPEYRWEKPIVISYHQHVFKLL